MPLECTPTRIGVIKETDITKYWPGFAHDTRSCIDNWWECIAALKNMLAAYNEIKLSFLWPRKPTPRCLPKWNANLYPHKDRYANVHSCFIHSGKEQGESKRQSAGGWNIIQHWEWTPSTYASVDESHEHNGQQNIRHRSAVYLPLYATRITICVSRRWSFCWGDSSEQSGGWQGFARTGYALFLIRRLFHSCVNFVKIHQVAPLGSVQFFACML